MNKIYNEEFFNAQQKLRYLDVQIGHTRDAYGRVLKRASLIENKLGKDLYDFSLNEIGQLLYILKASKLSTVMYSGNVIQNYIRWAIEQDLRRDNINPLDGVSSGEFYKQFVDTSNPILFHHDEIMGWVGELINHQEKLTVLGIYEGIYGRQYSELLTLKMDRVREVSSDPLNYEVELINETADGTKESRVIPISDKLYTIMRIANNEEFNFKNNGLDAGMKHDKRNLTKTDFIIRAAEDARTNSNGNAPAAPALVNRRFKKISDLFQSPTLTPTNIRNSGMLHMAYNLYRNRGRLGKEEYELVCERYNVGRTKNGGYVYARLKADFLNIENIMAIYEGE